MIFAGGFITYSPPVVLWHVVWALWFTVGFWMAYKRLFTDCRRFIKIIEDYKKFHRGFWFIESSR